MAGGSHRPPRSKSVRPGRTDVKDQKVVADNRRARFRFRDRAPTMPELAKVCRPRRSLTALRNALLQAEIKGWVRRNSPPSPWS